MKKRTVVIWCVIAVLAAGLAGWRLWPRSIDSFLPRPSREAERVSCTLTYTVFEDGPFDSIRVYTLNTENERESRNLLNILHRGQYQASFANLMPWTWDSMGSGKGYDGRTIVMTVTYGGTGPEAAVDMTFFGNDKASVNGRQVNPIGNDMFDELAEYILAEGEPFRE